METRQAFWTGYQPGFRSSRHARGSPEFFREVEEHRYRLEPHILEAARFEEWRGRDVLDAGCGIATDGVQFSRAGARYTGLDESPTALELARRRFAAQRLDARFVSGSVSSLPFPDASFDLVYSYGVIHHTPETVRAVHEFHRVLRPGGTALVMLYHRASLNYYVNIMLLRRCLVGLLAVPGAAALVARVTGEPPELLEAHRALLRVHGRAYLRAELFLSNNTDGPGNPLSKAYTRKEALQMFADFGNVSTDVRFLNLRVWPKGDWLARTRLARRLERHVGWHLLVTAVK
jgi:ubiquinone/menaquinone biosynthesis C-methylase UbiE